MSFPRRSTSNIAIGTPIVSGTVGSVLFVDTGPVIAQDNANLCYDLSSGILLVGTNTVFLDGVPGLKLGVVGTLQVRGRLYAEGATADADSYVNFRSDEPQQLFDAYLQNDANTAWSELYADPTTITMDVKDAGGTNNVTVSPPSASNAMFPNIGHPQLGIAAKPWAKGWIGPGAITANADTLLGVKGQIEAQGVMLLSGGVAIGALPASPVVGMIQRVTDALVPVIGSTVASGGSAPALVWYNGTNWTVVGK